MIENHWPPVEVLVADPPWSFKDKLPGKTRGAGKQYRVLGQQAIEEFALPKVADNAILFLWRVSSQVEEAYRVCRAWGFAPKSEIVWAKKPKGSVETIVEFGAATGAPGGLHFGMGHYVRAAHETCVVAVRGRFKVYDRSTRSVFFAPVGRHSEKPEQFYALVRQLVGEGPFARGTACELFGRTPRASWHVYGDELFGGYSGPGWMS